MKYRLLELIVCPECKSSFQLSSPEEESGEVKTGILNCPCGKHYEIKNFIPRFVETDDYVGNFSFEWDIHRETQVDKGGGKGLSYNLFFKKTGFLANELKGKLTLDIGVGTGRYADIVEKCGGEIVGIDLSYAVDSAFKNIGLKQNVHIIQANVFNLPFKIGTFDLIYSIGVLHHTPDCEKAFKVLPDLLKKGGEIAIWLYNAHNWQPGSLKERVNAMWRSMTTRMPNRLLYALCHFVVLLYYIEKVFPWYSKMAHLFLPGVIYHGFPGSNSNKNLRVRILDTFDWYSPIYQSKHTYPEVFQWFKESGLSAIEILDTPVSVKGKKV